MAGIPSPFDWKSLLTPAAALGAKALGDVVAPDASIQNAKTNAETAKVSNEISKSRMANSNLIRSAALPGIYTTLGYSPAQGKQMATGYGFGAANPTPDFSGVGTSTPGGGGGSKVGKTILGAGLTAAPFIPSIIGHAATATSAASGLGGLGAAGHMIAGLATNPITLAAAGALAAGLIWKHTQVHPVADKWVQGAQAPFDANWKKTEQAQQAGQISPQQAQQTKTQSAQNYITALNDFASQGNKNMQVARQAADTFRQYYGDPSQYGVQLSF